MFVNYINCANKQHQCDVTTASSDSRVWCSLGAHIMKRAAAGENQSTKRNKTRHVSETNFDNEALQRNATDLLHDLNDESGYISGHIFMTWAPYNRKTRIILETIEHSGYHGEQKHRFEVIFSGACTRFFDQLDFKSQDHVLLSLKGARVEKLARPSGACTIPLKLHYTEGVALTFVRRSQELSGQRQLVDTWYRKSLRLSRIHNMILYTQKSKRTGSQHLCQSYKLRLS